MSNPILIDPICFARAQQTQRGQFALSAMDERVLSSLMSTDGDVAWVLTGFIDDAWRPSLRIELEADVVVACGYCSEPVAVRLVVDSVLALFTDESKLAAAEQDDVSLDAIMVGSELDVMGVMEDEMIMSLPLSPAHSHCGGLDWLRIHRSRSNPFAILKTIKFPSS